jgi:hypothetical protein
MKVGDVILYEGIKYTITCFYSRFIEDGVEKIKVVETCYDDISGYPGIKVAAVNNSVSPLYVHIPIENVTLMKDYIQKFENVDGLWSAFQIALSFPDKTRSTKIEYTQDDYDGQHAEEKVLWDEEDLVLNPGEKPKRFKLFK